MDTPQSLVYRPEELKCKFLQMGYHFEYYERIDSTNSYLKSHKDLEDLTVIVANEQTEGRGRQERRFESKRAVGIYSSLQIKQPLDVQNVAWLSLMSGVCIAKVLQTYTHKNVTLKWPNDVMIDRKKVAGILLENLGDGRIILGFGINVFPQEFKGTLKDSATYLTEKLDLDKNLILLEIYKGLKTVLRNPYLPENKHSYESYLKMDESVEVRHGLHHFMAKIMGINDFGLLWVQDEKGKTHHLSSEEIHLIAK